MPVKRIRKKLGSRRGEDVKGGKMTLAAMRSAADGCSLGRGEKCRRRIKWGKWTVKGRGKGGFFGRGRQFPLSLTKEGLFGAAQYIERRSLLAEEE